LALRLFVALNWSANILLFYRSDLAGARFEMTTLSTTFENEAPTVALSRAELIAVLQALSESDKIALKKIAIL
jgi:hypothetical protein